MELHCYQAFKLQINVRKETETISNPFISWHSNSALNRFLCLILWNLAYMTSTQKKRVAKPKMHTNYSYIGKVKVLVTQSCSTVCDPKDHIPPGSSVYGILQARIQKWVAISSSRRASRPRYWTLISCVFCIAGRFFTCWAFGEAQKWVGVI